MNQRLGKTDEFPGGAIMDRTKRVTEPRNDYFVITKLSGLEPAQFVGRGKFGIDRRWKFGVPQFRSASNMAAKNTLQRKMPACRGNGTKGSFAQS